MRIGVMGQGVVGGTMTRVLQELGHDVVAYDPPKDMTPPLRNCRMIFVCVWTPEADGRLDQSYVWDAAKTASEAMPELLVVRSTVLPGTMTALLDAYHPTTRVAFVPEFLVEADPYGSTRNADRIVVGVRGFGMVAELCALMEQISPGAPVVRMTPEEAVMVKLASNGLLAAKVALSNELAEIADANHVDWNRVRAAVGLDQRIGSSHMRVTEERGYGGSCFPKDMQGLIAAARDAGINPEILEAIQEANRTRRIDAGYQALAEEKERNEIMSRLWA